MSLRPSNQELRADARTAHELQAVMPKYCSVNERGTLSLHGVDLEWLARTETTALYVFDELMLAERLRAYVEELQQSYSKPAHVIYAGKAFCCKAMDRLVERAGAWLDVSSGGELAVALAAGFPPERIMMHGNNKTPQEIKEALQAGIARFVVDTRTELIRIDELAAELNCRPAILLRITPGVVADTHTYVQTGSEDSKFGFSVTSMAEQALELALSLKHLELVGYHFHIGSQIFDLSPFEEAIRIIAQFSHDMQQKYAYTPQELDCGGGFGVAYQADDKPTGIAEVCSSIAAWVTQYFRAYGLELPKLYIEPGRSVVANAGLTLYTVGSRKHIEGVRCYINVDGGMSDNIRTCLYEAKYEAVVVNKAAQPRDEIVTISGKHCESGDVVMLDGSLQHAEEGDIVALFTTGAYNDSMASNYNQQVRPAVVFVSDSGYRVVKRRETYEDLLAREMG